MSFFTESKAGMAFLILGIISIIGGLLSLIFGILEMEIADTLFTHGAAVCAIGTIIYGFLYAAYGKKVRAGLVSAKIDILAGFVRLVGIATIITGLFNAFGAVVDGADFGTELVAAIVSIIIGLIIIWIAGKINDGKQTIGDKIIWIILLIIFIICFLLAILEIISIVGIIVGICHLFIYVFMLALLFDSDVKSEMGI